MRTIKTIAIVGAGFAGLCSAKVLGRAGFEVTVFEKEAEVGGVWAASRRYPGLTTQNPRREYSLSDFPMPDDYPEWPSGAQVQAYLEAYARHFGLLPRIRLGTRVEQARYDEAGQQWRLLTRSGEGGSSEQAFDWLVIGNGIFSEPSIPAFDGAEAFVAGGGRICHTSQFTRLEDARDRHVVVIGYGKSSCDVANATVGLSRSTTLLARHLLWKLPKKFLGVLNFKHLMLTRLGEGLFPYIERRGFERFLHGAGRPLRQAMLALVQAVVTRQLRLRELGLHPGKPLETITEGTVSLVSDGFYDKLVAGRLAMKGHAAISRLQPGQATLSTGETIPADLVICGTGWKQQVPFLDVATMARLTDAAGNFRLYRSILPTAVPRLAFVGYNSSFFSQLSCEMASLWLADLLLGGLTLPPPEARDRWIDERLAWLDARTHGNHCKGTNIVPFSIHNFDELLRDIGLQIGPLTRLRQWFGPVDPADYAGVEARLHARHRLGDRPATASAAAAAVGEPLPPG